MALRSSRRSPLAGPATTGARAGWLFGLAGLLPFFVGGAAIWAGFGRIGPWALVAVQALLVYAATIASFLGGVRWGFELQRPGGPEPLNLFGGVLPQIAASACLFLPMPLAARFGGLALVLGLVGIADAVARDYPEWYRTLRVPLTAGAVAAVLSGLVWALNVRHGG